MRSAELDDGYSGEKGFLGEPLFGTRCFVSVPQTVRTGPLVFVPVWAVVASLARLADGWLLGVAAAAVRVRHAARTRPSLFTPLSPTLTVRWTQRASLCRHVVGLPPRPDTAESMPSCSSRGERHEPGAERPSTLHEDPQSNADSCPIRVFAPSYCYDVRMRVHMLLLYIQAERKGLGDGRGLVHEFGERVASSAHHQLGAANGSGRDFHCGLKVREVRVPFLFLFFFFCL